MAGCLEERARRAHVVSLVLPPPSIGVSRSATALLSTAAAAAAIFRPTRSLRRRRRRRCPGEEKPEEEEKVLSLSTQQCSQIGKNSFDSAMVQFQ